MFSSLLDCVDDETEVRDPNGMNGEPDVTKKPSLLLRFSLQTLDTCMLKLKRLTPQVPTGFISMSWMATLYPISRSGRRSFNRSQRDDKLFDAHLMIENPDRWVESYRRVQIQSQCMRKPAGIIVRSRSFEHWSESV